MSEGKSNELPKPQVLRSAKMDLDPTLYADVGLKQLQASCHAASIMGGWWQGWEDLTTEQQMNILGTKIALIHSETSEMLEGLRKGKQDDHLRHRKAEEVEAADILIRLFDYAGRRELDLLGAVIEKMAYNAQRADHKAEHRAADGGKKF